MQQDIFEQFRTLIYKSSGIVLGNEKISLLQNRIQKRMRALNIDQPDIYLDKVKQDKSEQELVLLLDAVSTNVTHFYREDRHFQILRNTLKDPKLCPSNRPLKIWCAAASSGEEPYTIAIETADTLGSTKDFKILATDISTKVLNRAIVGKYRNSDVRTVATPLLDKYFSYDASNEQTPYEVIQQLKNTILFKRLNLVEFPYPLSGPIDIIFCRNVMIYFDVPTRQKIINQFENLLSPGGYLYLSHSENLLGINHSLNRFETSVYRK
jgi:chemotaxis protein methyltransferase CheR